MWTWKDAYHALHVRIVCLYVCMYSIYIYNMWTWKDAHNICLRTIHTHIHTYITCTCIKRVTSHSGDKLMIWLARTYIYIHIYIYIYIHTNTHIYRHAQMHAYTYTYTHPYARHFTYRRSCNQAWRKEKAPNSRT
jgi:hypothetical protein